MYVVRGVSAVVVVFVLCIIELVVNGVVRKVISVDVLSVGESVVIACDVSLSMEGVSSVLSDELISVLLLCDAVSACLDVLLIEVESTIAVPVLTPTVSSV